MMQISQHLTAGPTGILPPVAAWKINDPAAPWSGAWDVFDCVDMPEALANALLDELGLDDETCCEMNVFLLADMKITYWTEYGGGSHIGIYGLYVISGHDQDPQGLYTQAQISPDLMARLEAYVRSEVQK